MYQNRYDILVKTLLSRGVFANYDVISHDAEPAIHGRGQSCHVVSSRWTQKDYIVPDLWKKKHFLYLSLKKEQAIVPYILFS